MEAKYQKLRTLESERKKLIRKQQRPSWVRPRRGCACDVVSLLAEVCSGRVRHRQVGHSPLSVGFRSEALSEEKSAFD